MVTQLFQKLKLCQRYYGQIENQIKSFLYINLPIFVQQVIEADVLFGRAYRRLSIEVVDASACHRRLMGKPKTFMQGVHASGITCREMLAAEQKPCFEDILESVKAHFNGIQITQKCRRVCKDHTFVPLLEDIRKTLIHSDDELVASLHKFSSMLFE